jgi:hypothetical protein
MSSNPFAEYIRDTMMEIHSSFYPAPSITLPKVDIRPPRNYEYNFAKEKVAVEKYEEDRRLIRDKEVDKKAAPLITDHVATTAARASSSADANVITVALVPLAESASLTELQRPSAKVTAEKRNGSLNSFAEFESALNVFDLLEIKCLDDKAELEKLLLQSATPPQESTSSATSEESRASTPLRIQRTADEREKTPLPTSFLSGCSYPDLGNPAPSAKRQLQPSEEKSSGSNNPLVEKLLKEGYSGELISYCAKTLNDKQRRLLEFYVRAAHSLTSIGVKLPQCLPLLQEYGDTDKKRVMSLSENVVQLCGMGFDKSRVMEAFRNANGSRQAALDILLGR